MKTSTASVGKTKDNGRSRPARGSVKSDSSPSNEECPREQMIAEAAYYRAEQRGFVPGNEMSDWLQAEGDVEALLGNLH